MKLIPLTQGKFAMVDDEDYEALNAFRWHVKQAARTWYAKRYRRCTEAGPTKFSMHRIVAPHLKMVDHRDGNGLNNQRANLREGAAGNWHNALKQRNATTSHYKGVTFYRRPNSARPWLAQVRVAGKNVFSEAFASELEAALAYDEAARKWHREFAAVNFPRIGERSGLTGEIYMGEPALVDGEVVR